MAVARNVLLPKCAFFSILCESTSLSPSKWGGASDLQRRTRQFLEKLLAYEAMVRWNGDSIAAGKAACVYVAQAGVPAEGAQREEWTASCQLRHRSGFQGSLSVHFPATFDPNSGGPRTGVRGSRRAAMRQVATGGRPYCATRFHNVGRTQRLRRPPRLSSVALGRML